MCTTARVTATVSQPEPLLRDSCHGASTQRPPEVTRAPTVTSRQIRSRRTSATPASSFVRYREHQAGTCYSAWGTIRALSPFVVFTPVSALAFAAFSVLTPGTTLTGAISGNAVRTYAIRVQSGEQVACTLDQGESDLQVVVLTPGRTTIFDGRERGHELFDLAGNEAPSIRVSVRAAHPPIQRTRYRLVCDRPHVAEKDDRGRLEAEALETVAKNAYRRGDRESLHESLDARQRALSAWQGLAADTPTLVALLTGIADAHFRLGALGDADAAYQAALAAAPDDLRNRAEVLSNRATIARQEDRVEDALRLSDEALAAWRRLPVRAVVAEATALMNRGVLERITGELDAARRFYQEAKRLSPGGELRGYIDYNLAIVLESTGQLGKARGEILTAIPLLRGDARAQQRALVSLARVELALHDRRAARVTIERALRLLARRGELGGIAEADALAQRGRIALEAGSVVAARTDFERARDIARGRRRTESNILHDIGLTYLAENNFDAAIRFFREALARRQTLSRSLEAESLLAMSTAQFQTGQLDDALQNAESAVALVERVFSSVMDPGLRLSYFGALRQRHYAQLVDVLMALHRERGPAYGFDRLAFEVADRARGRNLVDRVRSSETPLDGGVPASLLARERKLRSSINALSWSLWQRADSPTPDAAIIATTREKLEAALAEHDDVEAEIRRLDPRTPFAAPPAVSMNHVQQALATNEIIVAYWLGPRRSYAWAVTQNDVRSVELPAETHIDLRARSFSELATLPDARGADALDRAGVRLSNLVWRPVAEQVGTRRIVLVTDGALQTVPFAALPSPGTRTPLVETNEIVEIPSAALLLLLKRESAQRPPAPKLLAAVGDPVFDATDPRVAPSTRSRAGQKPYRRLTRLPFSRDEVDTIVNMARPGATLRAVDFDATRELIMSGALTEYRYVHLATHTMRSPEHPELSGLVLSTVMPDGTARPGILRVQDVMSLRLQAELITLSACETGVGPAVPGSGLLSLANGWLSAAPRVVMTRTAVDDAAAKAFMVPFYRALFDGATPSAALRTAQRALRRQPRWQRTWTAWVLEGIP